MLVVRWRGEYVGGHMEEGVCWWSLSGGNMLVVTWRRELVVTWRREYVDGRLEEGICWWSPWKGRGICWDCGRILVSYYAQCEKNFCKKNPPPPLSFFWLDVLGDPGRGGSTFPEKKKYFGVPLTGEYVGGMLGL